MTKPFSARELVARVHAILRRVARTSADRDGRADAIGDVELDPATRRVRADGRAGPPHADRVRSVDVPRVAPGRVSTREELLEQVWGYEVPSGARTVDSHVRSMRRKLGADVIRTVHGVGYAVDDEAAS